MPELTQEYLHQEYEIAGKSTYEIAEACGTYPNKVKRALLRFGIELRDKAAAQAKAIATGRHKHPTKGRKHSGATRRKISEAVSKSWQEMSAGERDRRVETAKQQWLEMPEEQRKEFRRLAAEAVRKAADEGSKLEKFLLVSLRQREYVVEFHKEYLLAREGLHIDLYLPALGVAIEVDGPAHFYPIWGEENLSKHIARDSAKTGLLLQSGLTLIRVKHIAKNLSKIHERKLLTEVLEVLKSIESKSCGDSKYFEVEL